MKRRNFIIGAGSALLGASALVGSGAYSAAEMDRQANINVVNDDQGLLALRPGVESDVVRLTDNPGELVIDFTADGNAGGVNVDSRYQVGHFGQYNWMPPQDKLPAPDYPGDPHHLPAFSVINQDTVPHSVTIAYEFTGDPGGSKMFMMGSSRSAETVDSASNIPKQSEWFPGGDGEIVFTDHGGGQPGDIRLKSGGRIGVSIFVDTREGSTDDDLSGTMTISSV